MTATTHLRICPLCEATCGLRLATDGDRVTKVEGDPDDVFSAGYLCPKGVALADLHHDPDRLTAPLVRQADGTHAEVSWDEAFAEVERRLMGVVERHGREATAFYLGNPNAHSLAGQLLPGVLVKALGTRNVFTASTVDQQPKHVSAGLMFGDKLSFAVPDIDRTDFLLMLGADPLSSNGSLWTVPDVPGQIRALLARGGRLVVVDPRRSRTAARASRHHPIRPGADPLLLFALVHTLFEEDLVAPGRLAEHMNGLDEVARAAKAFAPERVAGACAIAAEDIRGLARELAAAERGCVYGRIGTHTASFGTLAAWLVDVLNVLTGNLDEPGGAMFPLAPAGQRNATESGPGRELAFGRWSSRVRGLPEVFGELPLACLAEELDTPGPGQIRALVTMAGNPALSAPDAGRLGRALASLECMVSVDIYLNETTRHADVILPDPSPLERGHYDFAFSQFAVRNTARWSPPVMPLSDGRPSDWEIGLRLAGIFAGQGADADLAGLDDFVAYQVAQREVAMPGSRVAGRDPAELLAEVEPRRGAERVLDLLLRTGPYDLTLADLEANPHGIDLGPLQPRIPGILRTPSGKVELAPEWVLADVGRLEAAIGQGNGALVLVGRRHLRSNNSWMHNLPTLASGENRCVLHLHPDDAAARGIKHGEVVTVTSAAGAVEVEVEVTDDVMPGVVSLPHGWGHDAPGAALSIAATRPGANSNVLTDPAAIDPLSGNAVLNAPSRSRSPQRDGRVALEHRGRACRRRRGALRGRRGGRGRRPVLDLRRAPRPRRCGCARGSRGGGDARGPGRHLGPEQPRLDRGCARDAARRRRPRADQHPLQGR
jgi:anaerobic selenocysteine-containing dehydrogenase